MNQPEYWLRGPIDGIPALLQPAAHALLQANDEIHEFLKDFPDDLLWEQPAGIASVAFHLQHIPGVLDRLFTYAAGGSLSSEQLKYLSEEGLQNEKLTVGYLLENLDTQVLTSLNKLKQINAEDLTTFRGVGRKQLPSTVIGLIFHAAEHTMRHTGQLLVTAKVVNNK